MKILRRTLSIILLAAGLIIFAAPSVLNWAHSFESEEAVKAFKQAASDTVEDDIEEDTDPEEIDYDIICGTNKLLAQIKEYNESLVTEGQDGVMDAWSVTQSPSEIDGLDDKMFGYITIPSMDVELPLYVGSSTTNMAKGTAILGGTSLPIGGENTNCVIAGHRGYRGVAYFREIEKLSIGDEIYITNPWETLTYYVTSIDIIDPYDVDAIKIQEGKDMITLLTCHPYRSHGKYRYVVYCERGTGISTTESENTDTEADVITASDGTVYESSKQDIAVEKVFRFACGMIIIIVFVIVTINDVKEKRRTKHRHIEKKQPEL